MEVPMFFYAICMIFSFTVISIGLRYTLTRSFDRSRELATLRAVQPVRIDYDWIERPRPYSWMCTDGSYCLHHVRTYWRIEAAKVKQKLAEQRTADRRRVVQLAAQQAYDPNQTATGIAIEQQRVAWPVVNISE